MRFLQVLALLLAGAIVNPSHAHTPTLPPPPSLRGNVVHIPTSGSDQTFALQSAINSAGPGDTIFFDQGGHIVCGGITYKAGQLYIGPSIRFPLLGQNS